VPDAAARARNALGVVGGSAAFAAAWWLARRPDVTDAEERVMRSVNQGPDVVYRPVYVVMQLGSLGGGLAAGALLARRDRRTGIATMLAVTAAWGGSKLVKRSTGRGRPEAHLDEIVIRGAPQRGLGFPSGHAGVATVVALTAASVLPRPAAVAVAGAAITTNERNAISAEMKRIGTSRKLILGASAPTRSALLGAP